MNEMFKMRFSYIILWPLIYQNNTYNINISILRETNSIYIYSINIWWTENRKKHNANSVERVKCTSASGRNTVFMRESEIQGNISLGLLLTLGLYKYHMFITVNISNQIR